jgi:hemerythrin-like domain-containing protein
MDQAHAEVGDFGAELLADPCAFLLAEHGRHRAMLGHLERLARRPHGPSRTAIAQLLFTWLDHGLPLHLRDEAESLLPRLAPVAPSLVARVRAEDPALCVMRRRLRDSLAPLAEGRVSEDVAAQAQAFGPFYRQRLAVEDAEVLPLARGVLDPAACRSIAAEMLSRRCGGA